MGAVDNLRQARETFERGDWAAAYDAWSDVDEGTLTADDLMHLASTAHLLGRDEDCIAALQRAFTAHLEAGRTAGAVRCAFWLGMVFGTSGDAALAHGWTARADRLLTDLGPDVVERGYVLFLQMYAHVAAQDWAGALARAAEVTDHGRRFDDPDLTALGLSAQGRLMLYAGQVARGLELFDEAMVGVAAGEVSPVFAGTAYCVMIEGCQEVSDLGRAAAWTAALQRWCSAQPGLVAFTGQCAVHRGQIMRLHGAFREAVEELDAAVRRYLASSTPGPAGLALHERGDVLRLLGDLDAADDSYARAAAYGVEPQPGLALLWQARHHEDAALAAVRRLLAETSAPVPRSRLLPSAVDVLVSCDRIDEARRASTELEEVARDFGCSALLAMAAYAAGRVEVASGDATGALPYLRRAAATWQDLEAPYERARVRVEVAAALRLLGDTDSAASELASARRAFDDVGARPDAERVDHLIAPDRAPGGLTPREVEVLRLVASGRSNTQIADQLVLSEKTVARHLSNIFTKIDVGSRTAAAAYAFEHRLV